MRAAMTVGCHGPSVVSEQGEHSWPFPTQPFNARGQRLSLPRRHQRPKQQRQRLRQTPPHSATLRAALPAPWARSYQPTHRCAEVQQRQHRPPVGSAAGGFRVPGTRAVTKPGQQDSREPWPRHHEQRPAWAALRGRPLRLPQPPRAQARLLQRARPTRAHATRCRPQSGTPTRAEAMQSCMGCRGGSAGCYPRCSAPSRGSATQAAAEIPAAGPACATRPRSAPCTL
mmetsp:Transcript_20478/g.65577  ORF Transcript_20478/g.65577 Transcript_20478/m.65577 type:complete len:228 (-) Transcript_20478:242-925(-)